MSGDHVTVRAVESAPDLARAAGVAERATSVASVVVLYGIGFWGISSELSGLAGVAITVVMLVIAWGWGWFHGRAADRRPWTTPERVLGFGAALAVVFPGTELIWASSSEPGVVALVAPTVPALVLGLFLILRWRR